MNKFLKVVLIFIFLTSCSLNDGSKFWNKNKIITENDVKPEYFEQIYIKEEAINLEFNPGVKIKLSSKAINKNFVNNFNNNGRINYNGNLKNVSKYRLSKLENFDQYDPSILFNQGNLIFFDNKGSILKFDSNINLLWKKNYYTKLEKKQSPILYFANSKNILIVADNIAKYYALDINTGDLLWSLHNNAPFNSQIKFYKDNFFIIDIENILRAYSIKDGKEIWKIRTENSLVRSQKKLSLVIVNENIYFNNSLGDISSVDINSGELIWQSPTQSSLVSDDRYFLKTSDIIADRENLFFSNNKNQFFSKDMNTGTSNWMQKINSNLRPTLIDNFIFTVSQEGYLIILQKNSGNIIRITDIFKNIDSRQRREIEPVGFIVGTNNIYLTTNKGKIFVIDIISGTTKNVKNIGNGKILRPSVLNESLYIATNKSIIKLD